MLNCGKFSNGHPFCHASQDGDAKCECLPGYKKINDNSCIDIDECDHPDPYRSDSLHLQKFSTILEKFRKILWAQDRIMKSHCKQGQNCVNTIGSYTCHDGCSTGYREHKGACVDVDECKEGSHNCGQTEECLNRHGSFTQNLNWIKFSFHPNFILTMNLPSLSWYIFRVVQMHFKQLPRRIPYRTWKMHWYWWMSSWNSYMSR